ncbi:MAG: hypothetical protein JXR77_12480 [Lentisphaeria bacterium]|nr:hypothetical protein [Lentisphaeria bacterium]
MTVPIATATALVAAVAAMAADVPVLPCEKLGPPMVVRALGIDTVTRSPEGRFMAWGRYETSERNAAVGIPLDGGPVVWLDTTAYGRGHVFMTRGADGRLYLYTGTPGRFLRHDPSTGRLDDLGVPAQPASYWMGQGHDREGHWYIGTYPGPHVVRCDTRTGQTKSFGPLTEDRRQKYCTRLALSDAGTLYAAVGLHHRELWALDPASGEKRQILPEALGKAQGAPDVWTGTDGEVYGRAGDTEFLCRPERVEAGRTAPRRLDPSRLQAGTETVVGVGEDGCLTLVDATGGRRAVPTAYAGRPVTLYSIGCEHEGRLWGGGLFPGLLWSFDPRTGDLANHGMVAHGAIQIYDIIAGPGGLYLASYMGCHIDLFDPTKPRATRVNPLRIAASVPGQERPNQWERGTDGRLYFGTTPAKGRLGGALVQVDPQTRQWRHWPSPLPDLSLTHLAAIPETGELLVCTSVSGGSSAIPLADEAAVFLWDPAKAAMTWSGTPVPGTKTYGRALRLRDGRVFGLAGMSYYLLDPVKRQLLSSGEMPVKRIAFPMLNDAPVGPEGLIHGIGDDALFAFSPAENSVSIVGRHPSLARAHGFLVTPAGMLYYGSGADLWRCDLR